MKTTIAILGILLGLTIQSQARSVTENNELQTYKDAVRTYLMEKNLENCSGHWKVDYIVTHSQSLTISEGEQPLMTFNFHTARQVNKADLLQVVITTDSSFKEISAMKVLAFNKGKVNDGTLKDPVMREGFVAVPEYTRKCK